MLLDIHALLWFVTDNKKLNAAVKSFVEDAETVAISIVSLWEIAIKLSVQKLTLDFALSELPDFLVQLDIHTLPITFSDLERYATLPLHHRDPFDRLLIAQALTHDLIIASADAAFDAYYVQRLWA